MFKWSGNFQWGSHSLSKSASQGTIRKSFLQVTVRKPCKCRLRKFRTRNCFVMFEMRRVISRPEGWRGEGGSPQHPWSSTSLQILPLTDVAISGWSTRNSLRKSPFLRAVAHLGVPNSPTERFRGKFSGLLTAANFKKKIVKLPSLGIPTHTVPNINRRSNNNNNFNLKQGNNTNEKIRGEH